MISYVLSVRINFSSTTQSTIAGNSTSLSLLEILPFCVIDALVQVSQKFVSEDEDEHRTEKVEYEVANDIRLAVGYEYRFEPEAICDRVDDVLHEFPQAADTDDGGENARAGITALAARSGVDESTEKRRGMSVCEMIPPPHVVVWPEHPDRVSEHRGIRIQTLPWPERNVVPSFDDIWERGRRERDGRIDDCPRIPATKSYDEHEPNRASKSPFDRLHHRLRVRSHGYRVSL